MPKRRISNHAYLAIICSVGMVIEHALRDTGSVT